MNARVRNVAHSPLLYALSALPIGAAWRPSHLDRVFDSSRHSMELPFAAPRSRVPSSFRRLSFPEDCAQPALHQPSRHICAEAPEGLALPLVVPPPALPGKAYSRTFRYLVINPEKTDRYDDLILRYAMRYRLDPRLIKAIIAAESEFSRKARSPAGAMGLMQLMPATANEVGVPGDRLFDPESNIRAGAAYLAHLFERIWRKHRMRGSYGQAPLWLLQRVIAAYNAGPRYLFKTVRIRQTLHYIRKVTMYYASSVSEIRGKPFLIEIGGVSAR